MIYSNDRTEYAAVRGNRVTTKGGITMKSKLTLWAAIIAVAGITAGCCCQASDGKNSSQQKPSVQKPAKAVTPEGEIFWIISVWDAQPQAAASAGKVCKTAKCFQTKDGKVLCGKPLKPCGKKSEGQTYQCCSSKKVMTLEHDPAKAAKCKTFAVKEVKVCPENGSGKCKAKEHVVMPGGKNGCAAADLKHNASVKGKEPLKMDDDYDENDLFMITFVD